MPYRPNKTSFKKGHQVNKKLTTDELKAEAYRQYCAHLAKGKSKRSWWFDHPDLMLTWETMEKYLREEKDNPIFEPLKKKRAECEGFSIWEALVEEHAKGQNDCVTPALQMVMRNKFGWDKPEDKDKESERSAADEVLDRMNGANH